MLRPHTIHNGDGSPCVQNGLVPAVEVVIPREAVPEDFVLGLK